MKKIAIIAPGYGVVNYLEILDNAKKLFNKNSFEVIWDKNICSNWNDLSDRKNLEYASNVFERLHQLESAINDDTVDIIWAFRCGEGAAEVAYKLLDKIKQNEAIKIKMANKILIGFSDITILHGLFNHFNIKSIHGPVITSLMLSQEEMFKPLIDLLSGKYIKIDLVNANDLILEKPIKGLITGGNLSVFRDMFGTELNPDMSDKIIILEDVGEVGRKIWKALLQMTKNISFKNVKAVILGDFAVDDKELEILEAHKKQFYNYCYENNIEVFCTNQVGHGKLNYPFVMMGDATIENNILSYML